MKLMEPEAEAQVADAIRDAAGPLVLRGGGTRGLGAVAGDVLSLAALRGVELYEPGALTLVVRAGTPLAEVGALLAGEGQRLAFEPPDLRGLLGRSGDSTIGGVVAANASGPRRVQAGACRDFVLGLRFVDGHGRVLRNGGRVMKNVTGYDLGKLMAGSQGTLGVLTEVALKVLPVPETEATLVLPGRTLADAVAAMAAALGSPFEVSGAAWEGGAALLRVEGFAGSVGYRAEQLQALLAAHGESVVLDPEASAARWAGLRDVAGFAGRAGDVWRIACRPSDAPALVARSGDRATVQLDWGGGLIWALVPEGTDLRARLGVYDGHATLLRGTGGPVFQPEAAPVAALAAGLRARFDPRGIFNRGLMG